MEFKEGKGQKEIIDNPEEDGLWQWDLGKYNN